MARLLIVEDEQRIASFLAKGLTAEGHQTTIADDGALGLHLAVSGSFDLVILDIGLPDDGRLRSARRGCGRRTEIPVIVLTARDSSRVSALEGGADDYMRSRSRSPNCGTRAVAAAADRTNRRTRRGPFGRRGRTRPTYQAGGWTARNGICPHASSCSPRSS